MEVTAGITHVHRVETAATAVELLAGKWSIPVLIALSGGTRRFHELVADAEGISRRMLTMTLRRLERDGLVERHVYARIPARVEYQLSEIGETLLDALRPLEQWGERNLSEVSAARARFDRHLAFRHGETDRFSAEEPEPSPDPR